MQPYCSNHGHWWWSGLGCRGSDEEKHKKWGNWVDKRLFTRTFAAWLIFSTDRTTLPERICFSKFTSRSKSMCVTLTSSVKMDVAWRLIKHKIPSQCDTTWSGIWIGIQRAQFLGCHFDLFDWTTGQRGELRSTASNRLSKTIAFINLPSDWIRISHVMRISQSVENVSTSFGFRGT